MRITLLTLVLFCSMTAFVFATESYQVEVLADGRLQVKKVTTTFKDGVEIKRNHRHCLEVGADLTNENIKVKEIANTVWTTEVIKARQVVIQARKDKRTTDLKKHQENTEAREIKRFKDNLADKQEVLARLEELSVDDPELKTALDEAKNDGSGLSLAALAAALVALGGTAWKKKTKVT